MFYTLVRTCRKTKQKTKKQELGGGSVGAASQGPRACYAGQVGNTHRVENRNGI